MTGLRTPIVTVITGEGGSGGALAIAVGDVVLALENAIYSVISPEGCASILWRTPEAAQRGGRGDAPDRRASSRPWASSTRSSPSRATAPTRTSRRPRAASATRSSPQLERLVGRDLDELVDARYARYRRWAPSRRPSSRSASGASGAGWPTGCARSWIRVGRSWRRPGGPLTPIGDEPKTSPARLPRRSRPRPSIRLVDHGEDDALDGRVPSRERQLRVERAGLDERRTGRRGGRDAVRQGHRGRPPGARGATACERTRRARGAHRGLARARASGRRGGRSRLRAPPLPGQGCTSGARQSPTPGARTSPAWPARRRSATSCRLRGSRSGAPSRSGDVLGHVDVLGVQQDVVAPIDGVVVPSDRGLRRGGRVRPAARARGDRRLRPGRPGRRRLTAT